MKIPQLAKKLELKSCHNVTWEDNYSWIHQKDILEVLKDKLNWEKEKTPTCIITVVGGRDSGE